LVSASTACDTSLVRRVAIAAVVLFGLAPVAASAGAKPPVVKASGKISALTRTTITIDGARDVTCRLGSILPKALGFRIGTNAKMTCAKGVLTAISGAPVPKVAAVQAVSTTAVASTSGGPAATEAVTSTGATAVYVMISGSKVTLSGRGTITAVGAGGLTVGGGVTCSLGGGSPDVSEYKIGDRVSFRCEGPSSLAGNPSALPEQTKSGAFMLTSIEPAA
jgi:hypothetical protein